MNRFLAFFILVSVFGLEHVSSANVNITSPPITDWGDWGPFQRCPEDRRAQGFQLKTEPFRGPFSDDTALNGIRLFCGDPFNETSPIVTSSEESFGAWGNVYSCYPGMVSGFQLRVEPYQGSGDDTATNNVRIYCSHFQDQERFVEGDGLEFGEWGSSQWCYSGQGVCGLQTQVENCTIASDCTALNNIRMECCE